MYYTAISLSAASPCIVRRTRAPCGAMPGGRTGTSTVQFERDRIRGCSGGHLTRGAYPVRQGKVKLVSDAIWAKLSGAFSKEILHGQVHHER